MKKKTTVFENTISRRHFMRSTSMATAVLGIRPLAGIGAPVAGNPDRPGVPGKIGRAHV